MGKGAGDSTPPHPPLAHNPAHQRVRVRPGGSSAYEVVIGHGLGRDAGQLIANAGVEVGSAFVVADSGLPAASVEEVRGSLAGQGWRVGVKRLVPSEPGKSLDTLRDILVGFAEFGLERRDAVVALGGGIVGDVAGFAAATYHRGVALVQMPTTLLAMVDASVGGKTGVNLRIGGAEGSDAPGSLKKNLVGAFHQPRLVLADVSMLASLPERHVRSGLAECLKHGLIGAAFGDPGLFDWTLTNLDAIRGLDAGALVELIARNVAVKASVVERDPQERETLGGRVLLNLGHTFGHAIETLPGLSPDGDARNAPLHHGEAVALGLVAASHASMSLGLCDRSLVERVLKGVATAGLPTRVKGLPDDDALIALMGHDKKVMGGRLRLIVPESAMTARVVVDPARGAVVAGWQGIRA